MISHGHSSSFFFLFCRERFSSSFNNCLISLKDKSHNSCGYFPVGKLFPVGALQKGPPWFQYHSSPHTSCLPIWGGIQRQGGSPQKALCFPPLILTEHLLCARRCLISSLMLLAILQGRCDHPLTWGSEKLGQHNRHMPLGPSNPRA